MNIEDFFNIFSNCSLFKGLSNEDLTDLFNNLTYRIMSIPQNTLLHIAGDICVELIIILKGTLSLEHSSTSDYKILTVYRFSEGGIIGCNTLFSQNNSYKLDIYSKSNCTLIYIPKSEILRICHNNPIILENLLNHLSQKSQMLLDKINILSNKNLRSSILDFIKSKTDGIDSNVVNIGMNKTELAKLMNVERTSLSRELKSMKNDGLIDFDRNTITILI